MRVGWSWDSASRATPTGAAFPPARSGRRLADRTDALDVLVDARLTVRGLGIATFVDRLVDGLVAVPSVDVSLWRGTGRWNVRGRLSTLARSGLFDLSPRLDPRSRVFSVTHFACNLGSVRPGPNSVLTVHDLMYRRRVRSRDRLAGALLEQCLGRAGRVVAVSARTGADVRAAFPDLAERVEVIPHGMRRLPRSGSERRHILAFGGGSDPRKRVDLMVAAYREYCATVADPLRLVVLSRAGLTRPQAESLVALGARLVADASSERVDGLMAEAAALLYPTAEEGFGLPILEAAEAGTPVVMDAAARVAAEAVGPHCRLVHEGDARAWARALDDAVRAGPVFDALALPGWAEVATRYAELYREVAR